MNYTFHQLQIFLKVCELKSITKAAEAMYLTQPAVSIQLKKFQEQFDIPLIDLVGRKIYVTDFGNAIAKVSEKIVEESALIKTTALQYKGLLAGKIAVSIVSTGKYVLPYFMSDFIKNHRDVDIRIDVTNKAKVLESLNKNEVDFALVSVIPDEKLYEKVELMPNQLFLFAGEEEQKDKVNAKQLANMPMIFREEGSATRKAMESYFTRQQIKPNSSLELVSNEAVKQAVRAGLGYSILPIIGMKSEIETGKMKIIETKGLPITTTWHLIYIKGKSLSPASRAFINYIEKNREVIIKEKFPEIDENIR